MERAHSKELEFALRAISQAVCRLEHFRNEGGRLIGSPGSVATTCRGQQLADASRLPGARALRGRRRSCPPGVSPLAPQGSGSSYEVAAVYRQWDLAGAAKKTSISPRHVAHTSPARFSDSSMAPHLSFQKCKAHHANSRRQAQQAANLDRGRLGACESE